jgi:hypothetical protein
MVREAACRKLPAFNVVTYTFTANPLLGTRFIRTVTISKVLILFTFHKISPFYSMLNLLDIQFLRHSDEGQAEAGIQKLNALRWIPAFAGMTLKDSFK